MKRSWFHHQSHERKRRTRRLRFEQFEQRTVLAATPLSELTAALSVDLDAYLARIPAVVDVSSSVAGDRAIQTDGHQPIGRTIEDASRVGVANPSTEPETTIPFPGEGGYTVLYHFDLNSSGRGVPTGSEAWSAEGTDRFGNQGQLYVMRPNDRDATSRPSNQLNVGHAWRDGESGEWNIAPLGNDGESIRVREFNADQLPPRVIITPPGETADNLSQRTGADDTIANAAEGAGTFDEESPPMIHQTATFSMDNASVRSPLSAGEGGFVSLSGLKSIESVDDHQPIPAQVVRVLLPSIRHGDRDLDRTQSPDFALRQAAAWTMNVEPTQSVSLAFDVAAAMPETAGDQDSSQGNEVGPDAGLGMTAEGSFECDMENTNSKSTGEDSGSLSAIDDREKEAETAFDSSLIPLAILVSGSILVKDRWQKFQPNSTRNGESSYRLGDSLQGPDF